MDPDQTAPTEAVSSWSTLFAEKPSQIIQQMVIVVIGALRVMIHFYLVS